MAKTVDILEKIDGALGGTEGDAKNIKESLSQIVEALTEMIEAKNEFDGGITLGKGTEDEVTVTAAQMKLLINMHF